MWDLATLVGACSLTPIETRFHEVLYNSFSDEYFRRPTRSLPFWRADILTHIPEHRNELVVIAEKA